MQQSVTLHQVAVGVALPVLLFFSGAIALTRKLLVQNRENPSKKTSLLIFLVVFLAFFVFPSTAILFLSSDPQNLWIYVPVATGSVIMATVIFSKKVYTKILQEAQAVRDEAITLPPTNRFYLASRPSLSLTGEDLKRHVHVIASTGAGKTKSVLAPLLIQAIRKGLPVIVIDPKGDLAVIEAAVNELEKQGRKEDFLYFDAFHGHLSQTYNPLINGTPTQIAARIMATLANPVANARYQFFTDKQKEMARAIVKGISLIVQVLRRLSQVKGKRMNFLDLYTMVGYIPESIEWIIYHAKNLPEADQLKSIWFETLVYEMQTSSRIKEFLSGLRQHLSKYAYGLEHAENINDYEPGINLMDVVKYGKVAYFNLQALHYPDGESLDLGKMIVMDFQSVIAWRQARNIQSDFPVFLLVDEAQATVPPEFMTTLEMARSAGASVVLIHQAREQFPRDVAQRIEQNTGTKVVMKVSEPETAEYYARMFGESLRLFRRISSSGENPVRQVSDMFFPRWSEGGMENYDYVVRPEKLMALRPGEAYILTPKYQIVQVKRMHYVDADAGKDLAEIVPPPPPKKPIQESDKGLKLFEIVPQFVRERQKEKEKARKQR